MVSIHDEYSTNIYKKCRFNIFCRIWLFQLFIPSIPLAQTEFINARAFNTNSNNYLKNKRYMSRKKYAKYYTLDIHLILSDFFYRPKHIVSLREWIFIHCLA